MTHKKDLKHILKYILIILLLSIIAEAGIEYHLQTERPLLAVNAGSMMPTYQGGDLMIVRGVEPEKIELGDVVVIWTRPRGRYIAHRVVDIEDKDGDLFFYTRGDAYLKTDQQLRILPPIKGKWIKGEVILNIPKLGYPLIWINKIMTGSWPSVSTDRALISYDYTPERLAAALKSGKPTVLEFAADWCAFCIKMVPIVDEFRGKYEGRINVITVNMDKEKDLKNRYNIRGLPSFIIFDKDGEQIGAIIGFRTMEKFETEINESLGA